MLTASLSTRPVTGDRSDRCIRSTTKPRLTKSPDAKHATLETWKSRAIERENGGARGAIGQRVWRAGAAWTSTLGRGGAKEKSVREGVGERETMSYPNEHVAAKTLSSCSPSEANEHVDSVRRSRRTSPRMRGVIHTTKVKQSRTITDKTGRPRVPVLLCYLIGASKSRVYTWTGT